MERVLECDEELVAGPGDRVGRVLPDVDEKQIEPAVAVVVEEDGPGRVPDVVQAGRRGNVAEASAAVVLEEDVSGAHGRDVEVRVAVVVDIGEGRRDADLAGHGDTG